MGSREVRGEVRSAVLGSGHAHAMNNADFRAFLIAPSAAASSDDAPAPLVPQKSGDELFAEPAAEPILRDADGSRLAISASHVDATCDLVALNPHADLWAESDDHRDVNRARSLGVMRTSHGFRRPLRLKKARSIAPKQGQ